MIRACDLWSGYSDASVLYILKFNIPLIMKCVKFCRGTGFAIANAGVDIGGILTPFIIKLVRIVKITFSTIHFTEHCISLYNMCKYYKISELGRVVVG